MKMLVVLVVFLIPPVVYGLAKSNAFKDYNIVYGCYNYGNMLDCSNHDFINLPRFSKWTKISTMVLFLRNMKYLDLSGMDVLEWPNLSQIYLNGNFSSYILFYFILFFIFG